MLNFFKKLFRRPDVTLPPYKVEHVISTLSQSNGWGITQLGVPDTWKVTQGEGITVMVIDTGYTDHNDLNGAMVTEQSISTISYERSIHDFQGHSSHCCGIIGARNNDVGMVGVAPKCSIITVKALDRNGSGSYEAINDALRYAIKIKPDVVSMSLGGPADDSTQHQLIKQLYDMNIPVIAAAGNDGRSNAVNYPGKYPETITVTAFDKNGNPAWFNSTGKETDFAAPGVDIYSTYLNNTYAKLSGTSMATPFIAGLVALLLAKHHKQEIETGKNDCKTVEQIKQHLIKYADDKGIVGKDPQWGYGVIDPVKLITASSECSDIPTPPETPIIPEQPKTILNTIVSIIKKLFERLFG